MKNYLFLFLAVCFLTSCKPDISYKDYPPVFKLGDDPSWAKKNIDDANWAPERGNIGKNIFWVRTKIELTKKPIGQLGLKIEAFGAFNVYWDGKFIGKNGEIISSKAEVPGNATSYFSIPDSLAQTGSHLLALRISQSYLTDVQRSVGVGLSSYENLLKRPLIITSFMNLIAGAFLIASLYYLFLYINSRTRQYTVLIFAVICFLFFALLILEYIKYYIEIPYTHFFLRLEFIGWITFALAMLVPLYFAIQFMFKWKKTVMSLLVITLLLIYSLNFGHYDITAIYYSLTMWIFSLIIVFNAIYQKEKGAIIVLIGLLLRVLINQYLYYDFSLFISFCIIVLCMLYLNTIQMKMIEEEYQSSLLFSSKLQLELIKKNIQPHFIKNTLTSLMDWVEESPKQGTAFIQALADEFDIINSISEQVLIPIRQEIELCKKHLSVMQFRKEINYKWEESGINEDELIPPALFHTLLENGITHSSPLEDGSMKFKLSYLSTADYKQYVFETFAKNRVKVKPRAGGNGFIYIKARLTESYGDSWEFTSNENNQGWISVIKIYTK
ncbi:histidine kinase [Pedobacter boryungensis]|uniref:Histidine kinase n=1 Tax=Pedobacter boryungensis TaxID=869962 RepID=A0ABX2DCP5_9SPHI|nr:histidine kinase [Pedobacter boryungensis]NQX31844.1 histidine kinase [Pedobacter boryungensis]